MSSGYNDIKRWILGEQALLDQCIANAAKEYYKDHKSLPYFTFDVNETISEMGILSKGGDLCYDRPTIGFSYSLWYHGRRLNGMLDFYIRLLLESKNEKRLEVFDLGAGTGAIQWAVGLAYLAMKALRLTVPQVKIINIDSSPFMLAYSRDYLWPQFVNAYPNAKDIDVDYKLISWVNTEDREFNNVWLCASYLFDHSENQELIADAFKELAEKYKPQKIILLGNWQKRHLIDKVADSLAEEEYNIRSNDFSKAIFSGQMTDVRNIRNRFNEKGLRFYGLPKWDDKAWHGRVLEPKQIGLGLAFPKKYDIYQKAEKDRKKIQLTDEQERAAAISRSPVVIIGPAGCGKSVVLTEKVKNIVEQKGNEFNPKLNILLTTFNKDLVKYLGDWLEAILSDKTKFDRGYDYWKGKASQHSYFTFKGSNRPNITIMHFDVLPTKIGGVVGKKPWKGDDYEQYHLGKMREAAQLITKEKRLATGKYKSILDEEFLLEEYHRVKYGMQCHTNKTYLQVPRTGRGAKPQLQRGKKRREIVVNIFRRYKSLLAGDQCESFIIRRERFLNKLNKGNGGAGKFTHVLVDELQDCCRADYDIFYALLENPNRLTVAGDLAQSINIGTTARTPPRPREKEMRRFNRILLRGSFRLPFRVGECIKPLSERIKEKFANAENTEVFEIIPYKGAPPGSRPIFIYNKEPRELALKIKEVFEAYKSYDNRIEKVDVMEKRSNFLLSLFKVGLQREGHIVQKIKGMEKPFVTWDTLAPVNTTNEVEEFVYTILTRTTNVLVIAVSKKMITSYFDIIKEFKKERLIFWDEQSRKTYSSICSREQEENPLDEEDDEDEDIEEGTEEVEI
ncbi:UvrD-helicase domain-containing protein [Ascidiimonas aurantiaca]|uniref:UvrD-helicase domain-containing protein n=1 Tax=Ascidiimonas aurantiaca TaxID=1685432 RepID=UPI0030EE380F